MREAGVVLHNPRREFARALERIVRVGQVLVRARDRAGAARAAAAAEPGCRRCRASYISWAREGESERERDRKSRKIPDCSC